MDDQWWTKNEPAKMLPFQTLKARNFQSERNNEARKQGKVDTSYSFVDANKGKRNYIQPINGKHLLYFQGPPRHIERLREYIQSETSGSNSINFSKFIQVLHKPTNFCLKVQ